MAFRCGPTVVKHVPRRFEDLGKAGAGQMDTSNESHTETGNNKISYSIY